MLDLGTGVIATAIKFGRASRETMEAAIEVMVELNRAAAEALVATAHEVCPYSNATRGNIEVALSVV